MRSLVLGAFFFLFAYVGYSQDTSKLSSGVIKELQSKRKRSKITAVVIGSEQLNYSYLKQKWKQEGYTITRRRKEVISLLYAQKRKAEKELFSSLDASGLDYHILHSYWVANFHTVELTTEAVWNLVQNPMVRWIELVEEQQAQFHQPVEPVGGNQKAVGGIENGLSAIDAPSLWKLGYTGKNTKMLSFDTGVWPDHPTFGNRFLGKHKPLDQAWYGYDSFYPSDKQGSHGSHTSGTVLGLDSLTKDTIGVAFNAYLMATDPIVGISSDIKSLAEIALAYEWALNPDGDTNTVDDIPDVINNSWGHTFDPINDSAACTGFFADVLVAVELADIISIQSAGNSGPADSTVGAPGLANMTLVNNFSVGAINGNVSSFPIASFSSRGPSHCASTGAFAIKPEVVAPGVNVRSAIRNQTNMAYEYANLQGTSMAAPHVSGLALLLREAFPQATAEEIKESIYFTAIDLGPIGEDNAYGRGMVNADSAYQYLSQLYTPVLPQNSPLDLSVLSIDLGVNDYTCDTVFTPVVTFNNSYDVGMGLVSISYGFTGETPKFWSSTSGMLNANASIVLDPISTSSGLKEFYVRIDYIGGMAESDYINNALYKRFKIQDAVSLPYREDFEDGHLYLSSFHVEDFDQNYTWDSAYVIAPANSTISAFMRHSRYSPRQGQRNNLLSPMLKIPDNGQLWMTFDVSYQFDAVVFRDSLKVWVSDGCSSNFDQLVYEQGPEDLNTTQKPKVNEWVPEEISDWRTDSIDLSGYAGSGSIMIKIESINNLGNNLYIDNINVFDNTGPVAVQQNREEEYNWKVYPNPVQGQLTITEVRKGERVVLYSILGNKVFEVLKENDSKKLLLDISSLKHGIYFVEKDNGIRRETQKIIVE